MESIFKIVYPPPLEPAPNLSFYLCLRRALFLSEKCMWMHSVHTLTIKMR